jgi:Phage integrase, N-terminal SAM-like domain
MTDECISRLRQRTIEDMTVRNFVAKTQTDYIRRIRNFAIYLGRPPDTATREDVRRYLLHLASSGMGASTAATHTEFQLSNAASESSPRMKLSKVSVSNVMR